MKNYLFDSRVIQEDMTDIFNRDIDWQQLYGCTVLVTGAAGMLASYLIFFLVYLNEHHNAKIKIIAQVRSQEKCRKRFLQFCDKLYFSICTEDILFPLNIEGGIDYIIHAAGLASPQYYEPMPVEVASAAAVGTYQLLELARIKNVKGFLFFSSGDIYGKLPDGTDITEDTVGTMDPLAVHSCYGEAKRMGETFCAAFAREYKVPAKIVRIAHTYAPTMDVDNDPRVFASFIKCILERRNIEMLSDGSARRPFCYIADAVAAFVLVLLEGKNGEAYNVSNTQEYLSILELAEIMTKLRPELGLEVIRKQRNDVYLENKLNKGNKPSADKLLKLGWKCHFSTVEGFGRVLRYFEEQDKSC